MHVGRHCEQVHSLAIQIAMIETKPQRTNAWYNLCNILGQPLKDEGSQYMALYTIYACLIKFINHIFVDVYV